MMKDGRKLQSEKSISAILEASRQQFADKGFDGARVDVIAESAGVNKAAIYYHFGDKESLYEKVLMDVIGREADSIQKKVNEVDSCEEKLMAMITSLASTVKANNQFASIMLREVASGGSNLPAEVLAKIGSIFLMLKSILAEGVSQGQFRKVSPFIIHMQIVGGMLFFVASAPVRELMVTMGISAEDVLVGSSAPQTARQLSEIVLNGLRVR